MKQHFYFFTPKHFRFFVFVKKLSLESFFAVISSQNLKMHGWRLPPGKISLPFKAMKNAKIADLVLSMNSSND